MQLPRAFRQAVNAQKLHLGVFWPEELELDLGLELQRLREINAAALQKAVVDAAVAARDTAFWCRQDSISLSEATVELLEPEPNLVYIAMFPTRSAPAG